jgi:hypothetical protein
MLKRRRILCGILGGVMLGVLPCTGCGKKADPIPPHLILPPAIADLRADSGAEGILLGWSATGTDGRIDHFRILRSEAAADQACPGCPQDYRPLATLKISTPGLRRDGKTGFTYVDAAVTAGRYYSYRVSACDSQGHCGEPSASAGLFQKQSGVDRAK